MSAANEIPLPAPHVIRLRGPWQTAPTPAGMQVERHFHTPTGMEASARVLAVTSHAVVRQLALNGEVLTLAETGRYDLTHGLQHHNRLVLDLEGDALPDDFHLRLEIHD